MREFRERLFAWLKSRPSRIVDDVRSQIRLQLGTAVLEAISDALRESLARDEPRTLAFLASIDHALAELSAMHRRQASIGSYRAWAGYWASFHPTAEELAMVVEAESGPAVEALQKSVRCIKMSLNVGDTSFLEWFLRHRVAIRVVSTGASPRRVSIAPRLKIADALELCVREPKADALELYVRELTGEPRSRQQQRVRELARQIEKRSTHTLEQQEREFVRQLQSAMEAEIRQRVAGAIEVLTESMRAGKEEVGDVVGDESKHRLQDAITERLLRAAADHLEARLAEDVSSGVECEVVGFGRLFAPIGWLKRMPALALTACGLAGAATCVGLYSASLGASHHLAASAAALLGVLAGALALAAATTLFVGHARIRSQMAANVLAQLATDLDHAVSSAYGAAAALPTGSWLRSVVQQEATAAAPRPLQKLAIEQDFGRRA